MFELYILTFIDILSRSKLSKVRFYGRILSLFRLFTGVDNYRYIFQKDTGSPYHSDTNNGFFSTLVSDSSPCDTVRELRVNRRPASSDMVICGVNDIAYKTFIQQNPSIRNTHIYIHVYTHTYKHKHTHTHTPVMMITPPNTAR